MSVKTIYHCNLCGVSSDTSPLQGLVFDTRDNLTVVPITESPLHICARCKEAVRSLAEGELICQAV